jgi:hypothetical protein
MTSTLEGLPGTQLLVGRAVKRSLMIGEMASQSQSSGPRLKSSGASRKGVMVLSDMLTRVVAFLRAGYPDGVPAHDYIPLLALLRHRLSDDEVIAVANEVVAGAG